MATTMFDTERFIAEIEKRPAIYDSNHLLYLDKNAKVEAWEQVCDVMVPKWRSLPDETKNAEEKILRGKWRNIRDYFMKEMKAQKLNKTRTSGKKRKKYTYYEQLHFLMPNVQQSINKRAVRSNTSSRKKKNQIEGEENRLQIDSLLEEPYGMLITHDNLSEDYPDDDANDGIVLTPTESLYSQFPKSICETSMASTTDEYSNPVPVNITPLNKHTILDEEDYDKMFLLSLLPMMRKLSEDKKLDVRIQMQQMIVQAIRSKS